MEPEMIEIGRHRKEVPTDLVRRAIGRRVGHEITVDRCKVAGKELKNLAALNDFPLKHSEALEAIAKVMGFDSFPALREQLNGGNHGR